MKVAIENMTSNPKSILLMDSVGAFLSATLLFVILSFFEQEVGVPKKMLYLLFSIACIFSIYSIFCYYFFEKQWRTYLQIVLIANMSYCTLTVILLVIFRNSITVLGLIYFILEIIMISCIAFIELKTVNKKNE